MANKDYSKEDGVWRTIGGRRVFIRNGQSLSDAMKESGKFSKREALKKDIAHQVTEAEKVGNTAHAEAGKRELERLNREEKEQFEKDYELSYYDEKGVKQKVKFSELKEKANKDWQENEKKLKPMVDKEKSDPYDDPESEESQRLQSIQSRYDDYLQKTEGRGASYGELSYVENLRGKDLDDFEKELDDFESKPSKALKSNSGQEKISKDTKVMRYGDDYIVTKNGANKGEFKSQSQAEEFAKTLNEEFEVGDLKKKAQAVLPKEDIDSHGGDLYIKKTKESEALINNMKNKDSGLLSTFKDQQTGETWYDIPFANMEDDYKSKQKEKYQLPSKEDIAKEYNNYSNDLGKKVSKDKFASEYAKNLYDNGKIGLNDFEQVQSDIKNSLKETKSTNETMNDKIRSKASKKSSFKEDLPKHTEIKEQGNSNRKEVSENIQAHILDYYTEDYTGEKISPSEAFVRQMDAMGEPNMWRAGEEIAKGGSYLIYNGDMADFLDSLKINPKGKKFDSDKSFEMYTSLIGRESAKLYDRIKRNAFNKYKQEHPLTKMTFEEFKDMNKR